MQSDCYTALDSELVVVLLMLDLSAAFDTMDHDIILSRLNSLYGISGDALEWFKSHLSNRANVLSLVTLSWNTRIWTMGTPGVYTGTEE